MDTRTYWQVADELAALLHQIVKGFAPLYFKQARQMLDSSSSVKSNIAAGYCRNALADYIRFCEIARASLGELGSQLQDCERWELVKENDLRELLTLYSDASYFLEQLIKALRAEGKKGRWNRDSSMREVAEEYIVNNSELFFSPPDQIDENSEEVE
jgi:four helix bundle protein